MGGRGGAGGGKPVGMSESSYARYKADGFSASEIKGIWKNTLTMRAQMAENQGKEQREITSSTYERAQKNLTKKVSGWFGKR
jgi:hypothetical protein